MIRDKAIWFFGGAMVISIAVMFISYQEDRSLIERCDVQCHPYLANLRMSKKEHCVCDRRFSLEVDE